MNEPFDTLALYDALPPNERAALDQVLAENTALAEAFGRWQSLRSRVRADLAEALPDRALLVLWALSDEPLPGDTHPTADLLDTTDRAAFDEARPALREALGRHPGLVDAVRRIRADRAAFDAAWQAHGEKVAERTPRTHETTRPRAADRIAAPAMRPVKRRSPVWRVAALAAAVAFAALLVFIANRDAQFDTVQVAEATILTLPDGSTAELAAGTTLLIPEADGTSLRETRLLAGRAVFSVRHDPSEPFTVQTPNALVTVLGTTFGVTVDEKETDVVLVSGAVTLASRAETDAPVRLEPGQQSRVLALDAPSEPASADLSASLAWTGDLFIRAEPMRAVVVRLSDAFGETVTVDDALASEVVSGTRFERDAGLDEALRALALSLDARMERTPEGGFHLAP